MDFSSKLNFLMNITQTSNKELAKSIYVDPSLISHLKSGNRKRPHNHQHIVNMAVEQSKGWENDIIMITHGDCEEDAQYVAKLVREKMGIENILINCIGSVIGSHTGPGVVAVFCMGEKR